MNLHDVDHYIYAIWYSLAISILSFVFRHAITEAISNWVTLQKYEVAVY